MWRYLWATYFRRTCFRKYFAYVTCTIVLFAVNFLIALQLNLYHPRPAANCGEVSTHKLCALSWRFCKLKFILVLNYILIWEFQLPEQFYQMLLEWLNRDGRVSRMGEPRKYKIFLRNSKGKRAWDGRRWQNNVKLQLRNIAVERVDLIQLGRQDKTNQW